MEPNSLLKIDSISLLTTAEKGKAYLKLDKEGYLHHFFLKNDNWDLVTENAFKQKILGFDAAVDQQGNIYLLGYNNEGKLLHLPYLLSRSNEAHAEIIDQNSSKKICHISSCLDNKNQLHIFYLAINEEQKMWWLYYLCNEKGKWHEKTILDFGYSHLEQYGLILSDYLGNIFLLYRLYEEGNYTLVLRSFDKKLNLPGKTFYLQQRQGDTFSPNFLVAPDNTLHISWLDWKDKIMCLNYIQRTPAGTLDNYFSIEIPQGSLTLAPLFIKENKLIISWKKNDVLFHLFSLNGGKNWRWGRSSTAQNIKEIARFRAAAYPNSSTWTGNYIFKTGSPPQEIMDPEKYFNNTAEDNKLFSDEFEILELLSSSLLTRAGNLQASNTYLKQKLTQQEKKMLKLYSWGISKTEDLEKKLNLKNMELEKVEIYFKNTLRDLQNKLLAEKNEIIAANKELTRQIKALQKEKEELMAKNLAQSIKINAMKEELITLMKEKENLPTKKGLLARLFYKRRE